MFGRDVYYIPRTLVKQDTVFGEDTMSKFDDAFEINFIEDNSGFVEMVTYSPSLVSVDSRPSNVCYLRTRFTDCS